MTRQGSRLAFNFSNRQDLAVICRLMFGMCLLSSCFTDRKNEGQSVRLESEES